MMKCFERIITPNGLTIHYDKIANLSKQSIPATLVQVPSRRGPGPYDFVSPQKALLTATRDIHIICQVLK